MASAPSPHANLPTLDEAVMAQLRVVMEDEFADLLATYLYNVPRELARLTAALAQRNTEAWISSAHAIKGSSANLGAKRLSQLCWDLETLGREGAHGPQVDGLLQTVCDEFAALKPLIERHRNTP